MATSTTAPARDGPTDILGIVLIVAGALLAAFNGALMKILSVSMSEFMVVWARYCGYFLVLVPVVFALHGRAALHPVRPGMQIVRAIVLMIATVSFVAGARTTPFAEAIAILYVYPFVLTILAPYFLGEKVPRIAWFGVICGFAGVLIVMRPSAANLDRNALLVLFCGIMVAIHLLFNRKLGPLQSPLITSMWGALIATLALSVTLPFVWQVPTADEFKIMMAIAATSAISQSMMLYAFTRASASELAPFTYTEIVGAIVIGWSLFGTIPDSISWIGMAVIVVSGLIVVQAPRLAAKVLKRRHPAV